MSPFKRIRAWRRRRGHAREAKEHLGTRREFVYLDEVSVCSLLASRKGTIATEFTDSQTASFNSELGGSMGGGFGVTKAEVRSRLATGQSRTSQVLRKATVQTSFKELYDLERPELGFAGRDALRTPKARSGSGLEQDLDRHISSGQIITPQALHRGDIIEVAVVLEADPIFRVNAIITTIREILEENLQLFSAENVGQLAEMRSVGRLLESLLADLVPIRGTLVDFRVAEIGGREWIVHRDLFDQLDEPGDAALCDVVVVGVAERDLFWKDIRRVLFSGSRFTVFCRLGGEGLQDQWRPIKLMDVLHDIHPVFGEQIGDLGEAALHAMEVAADASQQSHSPSGQGEDALLWRYVTMLAECHGQVPDPAEVADMVATVERPTGWTETVDERRSVLAEATGRVDSAFGVTTTPESACHLRVAATLDAGFGFQSSAGSQAPISPSTNVGDAVRFLDAEFIAIYW
ncbi:MAG: hypothetical protein OXB99_02745 [Acidimicrobiaceae bacterium]|nr:hypothetical protein [Acidimicrobiaceae bacterium]